MATYTLSGGCFWCLDAVFHQLQGVTKLISGYSGGTAHTATYSDVATGTTNHVETVQVTFDEMVLPAEALLDIFFTLHDPTTLNHQGADIGPQYASVMWYVGGEQKLQFEVALERAQTVWSDPIVTRIEPLAHFYPAESVHQNYSEDNPTNPYCSIVIDPKIVKVRKKFQKYFQETK